jgi:hypothetical protein
MPKLRRVSGAAAIRALERLGFEQVRQRGSHVVLNLYSALCRMGYPLIQASALSWALLADERRMRIRL